jgi:hypothetical protein
MNPMKESPKIVGLSSKLDEIPFEYKHLTQVWNSSSQMTRVSRSAQVMERAFALVDASDEITRKLIDENILIIVDTPTAMNKQEDLVSTEKRKSKTKISQEEKDKVNKLGKLFQND